MPRRPGTTFRRVAAVAVALAALAALGAPARAQDLPSRAAARPVVVASSEGIYSGFGDPAANRAGWIVFHATRDDRREGIYASGGGAPVPVAESGSGVLDLDGRKVLHLKRLGREPTVNDGMLCAFTAEFAEGRSAVLVSRGLRGQCDFVADSTEAFRQFGESAVVNAGDQVLFRATLDPPNHPDRATYDPSRLPDPSLAQHPERIKAPSRMTFDGRKDDFHAGLFLERDVDVRTLATTEKGLLEVLDGVALNDAGYVVYRASRKPGAWTLMLDAGGSVLPLIEGGPRCQSFETPAINARGQVAFVGRAADGSTGLFRAARGRSMPESIVDARSGFTAFGPRVSIDDRGRVAFVARRVDGGEGVFVASGPGDAALVLAVGDRVGRHSVQHARLGNRAFGRSDRLAVLVQLDADVEAIVVLYLSR